MSSYEIIIRDALAHLESAAPRTSKYIYWGDRLTEKILAPHRKRYAAVSGDEKVLFVLNNLNAVIMATYKVGIAVTGENLYYRVAEDSFVAGMLPKYYSGCIPLRSIRSIRLGQHDIGYGFSYNGHQLIVNEEILGVVRMGEGLTYDDATIDNLTYIFDCISAHYRPGTDEELPEQEPDEPVDPVEEIRPVKKNRPSRSRIFLFIALILFIPLIGFIVIMTNYYPLFSDSPYCDTAYEEYPIPNITRNSNTESREILSPDGKYTVRVIELDQVYPSGESYRHEKALVVRDRASNREVEIARHRDAPLPEDCLCEFENIEWSIDSRHIYFSCPVYATGSSVKRIDIFSGEIRHICSGDYLGYIRYGKYQGCLLIAIPTFENGYREYYASVIDDQNRKIAKFTGIESYSRSELISRIQRMD